jgi:hypothetical protein
MRKFLLFLPLAALLVVSSCKPKVPQPEKIKYKGMDQASLLKKFDAKRLDYKVANLKGKASFEDEATEQSMSFSYRISIRKDSLIVANISKMGFPGAMMLIDRDSMHVRIPLEKTAMHCDLGVISEKLGFDADFSMIQDILLGDSKPLKDSKLIPGDTSPVELRNRLSNMQVSWFLNGVSFKLEKMAVKDLNLARTTGLDYSDFQKVEGQLVPMQLNVEVTQSQPVRIELKHSDINFDQDKANFKFRIPDSYEVKPCGLK